MSLLPRGRFERWSWQIHVVALILQRPHLQCLTTNVFLIAPAKKVEILHLSTLYGHACFSLSCPCGRTMFECILVLSYFHAVSFSWVSPELRFDAPPAVPYFCFPVWFSTLLTGRCGRNCLYLNWLGNKPLAKRSFWKVVLADPCCGLSLAMRSISVTYCKSVTNHACQEGRNFAPVHAIWPCVFLSVMSLW